MPKERTHILLAEESIRLLEAQGHPTFSSKDFRLAYLLGSILPDILFYDLPSMALSPLGNALHSFEGETGAEILELWLDELGGNITPEMEGWILGLISHFLADGLWHPHISKLCRQSSQLCRDLGLSPRECHHWLESQLEGYWLNILGPPDGYLSLIRSFRKETKPVRKCIEHLLDFLRRCGFSLLPSAGRLTRCLLWQLALLQLFAHPGLVRWGRRLIARKKTRFLGTLIVPAHSDLPALAVSGGFLDQDECRSAQELSSGRFMAETVTLLSTRLRARPTRL